MTRCRAEIQVRKTQKEKSLIFEVWWNRTSSNAEESSVSSDANGSITFFEIEIAARSWCLIEDERMPNVEMIAQILLIPDSWS